MPKDSDSQIYAINAKVEGGVRVTQKQMNLLLQNLLAERFHLKVHRDQKILPGYALTVAKGGPKLKPTQGGPFFRIIDPTTGYKIQNDSVANFAKAIAVAVQKPVADKTGLDGQYDFELKFAPDEGPTRDDPRYASLPDIFTALQVQLGLKLVPQKIPVDFIVVDHVEAPSEN